MQNFCISYQNGIKNVRSCVYMVVMCHPYTTESANIKRTEK